MQRNGLQVQTTVQIDRSDNVSLHCVQQSGEPERGQTKEYNTHCNVGTMPLTPGPAPGVAAGVAGEAVFAPCWPFAWPLFVPLGSFSEDGGVKSPAPPGKDKDAGDVNAFACCAVDGWVVRESMIAVS